MRMPLLLFVGLAFCACVLLSGCGDAVPLTTKLAAALTQKYNYSCKGRAPEIIVRQFFDSLSKADFTRAATYCDGDMKLFMEYCIAKQKMLSQEEKGFWDREFRSFSGFRLKKIQWVKSENKPADNHNPEFCILTYSRAPYKEFLLAGNRPRAFELAFMLFPAKRTSWLERMGSGETLAFMLFPAKRTSPAEEKKSITENVKKDFTVVDVPACTFQVILSKNSSNEFKITNFAVVVAEESQETKSDAEKYEYDQEFMNLSDEPAAEEKKNTPAPQEDSGMTGDDFGFGEL